MDRKGMERVVETIDQIPTLPIVSRQIMLLLEENDVPMSKIAELKEKHGVFKKPWPRPKLHGLHFKLLVLIICKGTAISKRVATGRA